MIAGWKVHNRVRGGGVWVVPTHVHRKPTVVNPLGMLIHENPRFGRPRVEDLCELSELPVTATVRVGVRCHRSAPDLFVHGARTDVGIHRHAANPRRTLLSTA